MARQQNNQKTNGNTKKTKKPKARAQNNQKNSVNTKKNPKTKYWATMGLMGVRSSIVAKHLVYFYFFVIYQDFFVILAMCLWFL